MSLLYSHGHVYCSLVATLATVADLPVPLLEARLRPTQQSISGKRVCPKVDLCAVAPFLYLKQLVVDPCFRLLVPVVDYSTS